MIKEIANFVVGPQAVARPVVAKVVGDAAADLKRWAGAGTSTTSQWDRTGLPLTEQAAIAGKGFRAEGTSLIYSQQSRESVAQALVNVRSAPASNHPRLLQTKDGALFMVAPHYVVADLAGKPVKQVGAAVDLAKLLKSEVRLSSLAGRSQIAVDASGKVSIIAAGGDVLSQTAGDAQMFAMRLGQEVWVRHDAVPAPFQLKALAEPAGDSLFVVDTTVREVGATAKTMSALRLFDEPVGLRMKEGTVIPEGAKWRFFPSQGRPPMKLVKTLDDALGSVEVAPS